MIYRDLGKYDIEISGGHRNTQPVSIYVWQKRMGPMLIEQHVRVGHKSELIKKLLDDISDRYMNKEDEINE